MKRKLAIITSHPIQYNTPLFKLLTERGIIEVMVFYTWGTAVLENKYDPGFAKVIHWDIPLLDGYSSQFAQNSSKHPGSHHFNGIVNPGIIDQINAWQPDSLLVYGWSFRSHLNAIRYYKGKIPIFFRGDSTLLNDKPGIKSTLRRIFLKWVYKHVDKAFYVGQNNKDYFKKAGLKEHQLIYAPHVVDNDFFQDKDEEYDEQAKNWRRDLGIADNDTVFLFAGKLEHTKSLFTLLEVFNQSSFPREGHLVIVGNGNLESDLKGMANNDHIHFIDFQNQKVMPVVYRLGDVFVLPSRSETWGLSINEAMASGRAVIASSKCGGAIDLIKEGYNGYIFKAENADDLNNKILLVLKNIEMIKEMGGRARIYIQQFELKNIALQIEEAVLG